MKISKAQKKSGFELSLVGTSEIASNDFRQNPERRPRQEAFKSSRVTSFLNIAQASRLLMTRGHFINCFI